MAIDHLLDEHEQGERVRGWLRENGGGLLTGILLGLALILGWQWWQQQRANKRLQAGNDFQAAAEALQAGKTDVAQARIAALPEGTYRTLAQLALARAQVQAGKRDEAIATLRGVKADSPELAGVVRNRLARLLVDAGQAKEALALLEGAAGDPLVAVVRGDAHAALGQRAEAGAA